MRRLLVFTIVFALLQPTAAAPVAPAPSGTPDAVLKWIKNYRAKPNPMAVPAVIRALSAHGTIKDPDASGVYVGFYAGVLGANPAQAWPLIENSLPLPFEDQWIVIRALAYSGLPQWKDLMRALALRVPDRQVMAQRYLDGELPALNQVSLEPAQRSSMDKVKGFFSGDMFSNEKKPAKRQITFQSSPELIDALWGIYYATGSEAAIAQIVVLLPWSKDRDNTEKLTIGSMAKFTLASNAARDAELLGVLKHLQENQSNAVKPILAEVIEAAELVDTARIGKEAVAALEELKKKGPGSTRELMTWGSVSEAAISFGCLGLAAAGQVEAGIPCVVGGALTTGALRYLGRTD
ncbi:MAG: hypothetical protein ACLP7P_00270 [Rhodomicrobium sp.]